MSKPNRTSKAKILIVEDEAIVATDIARNLDMLGYTVVEIVASGLDALSATATYRPDVVLMDIHLQDEMDGIEAAQRIRAEFQTPVIYLTAYADPPTLSRAKPTEPLAYLVKPFKLPDLQATLEVVLHRYQIERQTQKTLFQTEQRLQQQNQHLTVASHEFRNSLALLQGSMSILQKFGDQMTSDKRQQHLEGIKTAVTRLNQLAEELVNVGKTGGFGSAFTPSTVEVVNFCTTLLDTFRTTSGRYHQLELATPRSSMTAYLDPKLLWTILSTLLSTLLEFSSSGSTLVLSVEMQGREVQFELSTQGIGIPLEIQQDLLGQTEGMSGRGIVKRCVDLHQGQLRFSYGSDQRSRVVLLLPSLPQ